MSSMLSWNRWFPRNLSRVRTKTNLLRVLHLEDRVVPAAFEVSNTNDAGAGSLRQAITDVNASADPTNAITFLAGLSGTINITSANLPTITKAVDIQGPGTAIITVDGNNSKALFNINDGTGSAIDVSISGLTITRGKTTDGGAIFSQNENVTVRDAILFNNTATGQGGGIRANGGTFTLINTQVHNNTAADGGGIRNGGATFVITASSISNNTGTNGNATGGIYQSAGAIQDMTLSVVSNNQGGLGGGMYVTGGPVTIVNSLISDNRATNVAGSRGGGIEVTGGNVVLRNVTISGNKANNDGGGIYHTGGTLEIRNSTIAFNTADANNSGAGTGGGLFATAGNEAKIFSTIIAENKRRTDGASARTDVQATVDATSAFNLIGVNTGLTGITNATQGNIIGTAGTPRDPQLSPLAYNGGITKTHRIADSSDAKDVGSITGVTLTTDGRGEPFARVVGTKADIGAFEIQTGPVSLVVTTAADENDATYDPASLSLREALRFAGTDAPVITFDASLGGQTITLTEGRLVVNRTVDIQGLGADLITVDGASKYQLFFVDDSNVTNTVTFKLSNITLQNGFSTTSSGGTNTGGAIHNRENLVLTGVNITGSRAKQEGGGVYNLVGTTTITNSSITNNKADSHGAGVANVAGGTVSITNSTLSGNLSKFLGGGLYTNSGTAVLSNSTLSANQANGDGGGVHISSGTLIVNNTTLTLNKADADNAGGGKGGGISRAAGTATAFGTIVSKNEVGTTGANPDISGTVNAKYSLVFNTTGWDQSGSSNNKLNQDPLLGPLADNGGPTQTHALGVGSPAIDPGFTDAEINPDGLTTDQRGLARLVGAGVDIGAFEFAPNTAPTISDIPNQTMNEGATLGPIAFTVGDAETDPAALTITTSSDNATLITPTSIALGGAGANRTLTITPAAGQSGSATITVTVTDGGGLTATDTFTLTVNSTTANTPPTISSISNQFTATNTAVGPIAFTVGDTETSPGALTVTATSSNTTLVPVANVTLGGTDASRTVTVTPAAGQTGTSTITLTVTDGGGLTATSTFTLNVTPTGAASPVLIGFPQYSAGADRGAGQAITYNPDGSVRFTTEPFPGSTGGVRVASADFNGDGVADLVAATGPGRATQVRVLDGKTQAELFNISPFEAAFTGGLYVSAGDLNGDGVPDLVITPDEGGGPRVRIFSGAGFGQIADFFGIDDPNFRGGARSAVGDLNGDGAGDLVVAAGFLGGPRVAAFSGPSLGTGPVKLFNDFFAFEQTLRNGVYVAVGDLTGDGKAEIIAGGGPGGGPRVTAFSSTDLINSGGGTLTSLANFFGGDPDNRGGIRLAVHNLDGDNRADLVVGAGEDAGSRVTSYLGKNIAPTGTPPAFQDFDAIPGFTGGIFVG